MEEAVGPCIITKSAYRQGRFIWYKDIISPEETKVALQPLLNWYKLFIVTHAQLVEASSFCVWHANITMIYAITNITLIWKWHVIGLDSEWEMIGSRYSKMIQCFAVKGTKGTLHAHISTCKIVITTKWYPFHAANQCFLFNDYLWRQKCAHVSHFASLL